MSISLSQVLVEVVQAYAHSVVLLEHLLTLKNSELSPDNEFRAASSVATISILLPASIFLHPSLE